MKLLQERRQPLLARKEVALEIEFDAVTPSNVEVAKKVAEKMKVTTEVVVVRNIYSEFGEKKAVVKAYIYESKEKRDDIEPKPKERKNG